jgi:hypothetical protein
MFNIHQSSVNILSSDAYIWTWLYPHESDSEIGKRWKGMLINYIITIIWFCITYTQVKL